jgi:hypothetical protein
VLSVFILASILDSAQDLTSIVVAVLVFAALFLLIMVLERV